MQITANPKWRIFYTVWAFLECLGFGGLLLGWGSLVYVLKEEGIYANLCENESSVESLSSNSSNATSDDKGCEAQNSRLALVFAIASSLVGVGSLVIGQINFKYGTRASRIISTLVFMAGAFLVAFTSKETPWLIFPGMTLVGIAGVAFLMTNTQVSNLYPTRGAAVVGILCGGFDTSAGIQLMVKLGYEAGISLKTSNITIGGASALTFISTFLFLPKDFIHKELPGDHQNNTTVQAYEQHVDLQDEKEVTQGPAIKDVDLIRDAKVTGEKTEDQEIEMKDEKENEKTVEETNQVTAVQLKKYVFSMTYVLHVLWVAILQLRFFVFMGTVNTRLEYLLSTKSEVSHYTNALLYILMGGVITSPFAGFVYNVQYKCFNGDPSQQQYHLMPAIVPLTVTTVVCVIWSGLILLEHAEVLYAVFILVLIFRSFLYTMTAGYISAVFPSACYGSLYGLTIVFGGIVGLLQYPLYSWAEGDGFYQANLFLLVFTSLTFIHPAYQWWSCRRHGNSR